MELERQAVARQMRLDFLLAVDFIPSAVGSQQGLEQGSDI